MYANDSFFTLSLAGQFGLLALSAALSLTILVIFWKTAWRANIVVRLGMSIFVLWLFVWLSPQAYYTYYLFLFDGLEFKNVIKLPPTMVDIFLLLTFSDRANFSNHGKGLLGWGMIILSIIGPRRHRRCKRQTKVQSAEHNECCD